MIKNKIKIPSLVKILLFRVDSDYAEQSCLPQQWPNQNNFVTKPYLIFKHN
jgi:hypothetical protein